jgi:hypothetical protein
VGLKLQDQNIFYSLRPSILPARRISDTAWPTRRLRAASGATLSWREDPKRA